MSLLELIGLKRKTTNYVSLNFIEKQNDPVIKQKLIDMNTKMNPYINDKTKKRQLELTYVSVLLLVMYRQIVGVRNNNSKIVKITKPQHPDVYKTYIITKKPDQISIDHQFIENIANKIVQSVSKISEYFSREFTKIMTNNEKDFVRAFSELILISHNKNVFVDFKKIKLLFNRNHSCFANMLLIHAKNTQMIKMHHDVTSKESNIHNKDEAILKKERKKLAKQQHNIKKQIKQKKKHLVTNKSLTTEENKEIQQHKMKGKFWESSDDDSESENSNYSQEEKYEYDSDNSQIGKENNQMMRIVLTTTIVFSKISKIKIHKASVQEKDLEYNSTKLTRQFYVNMLDVLENILQFLNVEIRNIINTNRKYFAEGMKEIMKGVASNTHKISLQKLNLLFLQSPKMFTRSIVINIEFNNNIKTATSRYVKNRTMKGKKLTKDEIAEIEEADITDGVNNVKKNRATWLKKTYNKSVVYEKIDETGPLAEQLKNVEDITNKLKQEESIIDTAKSTLSIDMMDNNILIVEDSDETATITFSLNKTVSGVIKKKITSHKLIENTTKTPNWITEILNKTKVLILDISNLMKASKLSIKQINEFCTYVGHFGVNTIAITNKQGVLLNNADINTMIPQINHDDELILQYAHLLNAVIVSSDTFKEFSQYMSICTKHNAIIFRKGSACHANPNCKLKMCRIGIKGKMYIKDIKLYNDEHISMITLSTPLIMNIYDKPEKTNYYATKDAKILKEKQMYRTSLTLPNNSTPVVMSLESPSVENTVVTISFSWANRNVTSTSSNLRTSVIRAVQQLDEDELNQLYNSSEFIIDTNNQNKICATHLRTNIQYRVLPTYLLSNAIIKNPVEVNSKRWKFNTVINQENHKMAALTEINYTRCHVSNIINGEFFFNERLLKARLMICDIGGKFEFTRLSVTLGDELQKKILENMSSTGTGINYMLVMPKTENIEKKFTYKPYQSISENVEVGTDVMVNSESANYPMYNNPITDDLQLGLNMPDIHLTDEKAMQLNAVTINMFQIYRTKGNKMPFDINGFVRTTNMDDNNKFDNAFPMMCAGLTEKPDILISAADRDYNVGSDLYSKEFCKMIRDKMLVAASSATNKVAIGMMRFFNDLINKKNKMSMPRLVVGYNIIGEFIIKEEITLTIRWRLPLASCEMILTIAKDKQYCLCLVLPSPPITIAYVAACIGSDVEFTNGYNEEICKIYEEEAQNFVFGTVIMIPELSDYLAPMFLIYGIFSPALRILDIDPDTAIIESVMKTINPFDETNLPDKVINYQPLLYCDTYEYIVHRANGNVNVRHISNPFQIETVSNIVIHQIFKALISINDQIRKRRAAALAIAEIGVAYGYATISNHIFKCTEGNKHTGPITHATLIKNLMNIKEMKNCSLPMERKHLNKEMLNNTGIVQTRENIVISTENISRTIKNKASTLTLKDTVNNLEYNVKNAAPCYQKIFWIDILNKNQRTDRRDHIEQLIITNNKIIRYEVQQNIGENEYEQLKRSLAFATLRYKNILITTYDRFPSLLAKIQNCEQIIIPKDITIYIPDVLTFNKLKYILKSKIIKKYIDEQDIEPYGVTNVTPYKSTFVNRKAFETRKNKHGPRPKHGNTMTTTTHNRFNPISTTNRKNKVENETLKKINMSEELVNIILFIGCAIMLFVILPTIVNNAYMLWLVGTTALMAGAYVIYKNYIKIKEWTFGVKQNTTNKEQTVSEDELEDLL